MDFIYALLHIFIVIIYLSILRIGVKSINNRKTFKVEIRTLLIIVLTVVISYIILIIPVSKGIQSSFAKGGLIVAVILILFVVWLRLVKKINQPLYEKSAKLLDKFLLNLI